MTNRWVWTLILAGFLALIPIRGYSDGVFVWNSGADLYAPMQKALIHFSNGHETLVLQVRYEGPTRDFGWLLPVPAKPEISVIESDNSPFAELSKFTQRRVAPPQGRGRSSSADIETVQVISRDTLGLYDVAVLSASDPAALADWLSANGYRFPDTKAHLLKHYTDKHWFYIALRIDPEALEADAARQLNTGEIQPLRMRFRSDEPVYPLKITSANAGNTELLLYVLAETPLEDRHFNGFAFDHDLPIGSFSANPTFRNFGKISSADPIVGTFERVYRDQLPLTWKAAQITTDQGLYLMKYRATFSTVEFGDDLVFRPLDESHILYGFIQARRDLRSALSTFQKVPDAWAKNIQARVYATHTQVQYRDGKRAVRLAEEALDICRQRADSCQGEAEYIDTLAAAYAQVGQFDLAVSLLTELTEKLGPDAPERYLTHLQSYREGRPWRE